MLSSINHILESQPVDKFLSARDDFKPVEIIQRQFGVRPFQIKDYNNFFLIRIGKPFQEIKYWYPKYVKTTIEKHSFSYKTAMHIASQPCGSFDYAMP